MRQFGRSIASTTDSVISNGRCESLHEEIERADVAPDDVAPNQADGTIADHAPRNSFAQAASQIIVADVSMSLDNVLAVAGAAREHLAALIIGLSLSVALMGIAAG